MIDIMCRSLSVALLAIIICACAPHYGEKPAGENSVWCNHRYLPTDRNHPVSDSLHLQVAKRGYLYSLIAAYVLQQNNAEGQSHMFVLPNRVKEIKELHEKNNDSGFEARSFKILSQDGSMLDEVVIAFTGSNDNEDWKTNLSLDKTQYLQAEKYVERASLYCESKFNLTEKASLSGDIKFIVTGYSLGAGLAAHVTKTDATSNLIKEAWLFNPSPKTWSNSKVDDRIWQASTRDDILKIARAPIFRILPGVDRIGAPPSHRAEDYYFIHSNKVYAHFRWVLTRDLLFEADLELQLEHPGLTEDDSEPMRILKMSHFSACASG